MSDLNWVDELKVVELRKRLKDLGENATGKKAVLVERLKQKLAEEAIEAAEEPAEEEKDEDAPVSEVESEDKKEGGLDALLGDGEDDLEFDFDTDKPIRKKPRLNQDPTEEASMEVDAKEDPAKTEEVQKTTPQPDSTPKESTQGPVSQPTEEVAAPEVKEEDRTRALHIANFVRPFTEKAACEMLSEYGTIEEMWMPNIKTHCYVLFENKDNAHGAYLGTYNVVWPRNGNPLIPRFVSEEEAKKAIEEGKAHTSLSRLSGSSSLPTPRPATSAPQPPAAAKPNSSLEDLFFKTDAKPHIYYLPLTEEQVEAKKQGSRQVEGQPSGDVTGE